MQKRISVQLKEFLQKHNMELAYKDGIRNAEFIEAIKYFLKDISVDEQEFTIHALNSYANKFKTTMKNWSNDPLTEWLKERKNQFQKTELKTAPTIKSTHKQQMLILHYLGFLDKIHVLLPTLEKRAELLTYILNRDIKNTKTYFSLINLFLNEKDKDIVKTPNNLDFVEKVFLELGLQEFAQNVKEDKKRLTPPNL